MIERGERLNPVTSEKPPGCASLARGLTHTRQERTRDVES
jgi:hypothetical protein